MYDVIILGAGPAGVTAAIYCARYKIKTLVLSYNIGGWVNNANVVENIPSRTSVPGLELVKSYKQHIKNNELEYIKATATHLKKEGDVFKVKTNKGEFEGKIIVYGLGTKKRMLGIPGEGKWLGKGVHTCATCDAPFFTDMDVVVVGGNDSGAKTALLLAEYAKKVYVVEFMEKMPTEPTWLEMLEKNEKIEIITGTTATEIHGEKGVEAVTLKNGTKLDCQGVFIEIGADPSVSLAKQAGVEVDKYNCIAVDASQKTNIDGLYAIGDVTNGSNYLRQIATAQSEGAIAANSIYKDMMSK